MSVRCKACDGVGHLSPATRAHQRDYGRACPMCDGTGDMTVIEQMGRALGGVSDGTPPPVLP